MEDTKKASKEVVKEKVHPLLDDVSATLLIYLGEAGGCFKEDLMKVVQ